MLSKTKRTNCSWLLGDICIHFGIMFAIPFEFGRARANYQTPQASHSRAKVSHMGICLGANETVVSHGKASYVKQEKLAKMLREGA